MEIKLGMSKLGGIQELPTTEGSALQKKLSIETKGGESRERKIVPLSIINEPLVKRRYSAAENLGSPSRSVILSRSASRRPSDFIRAVTDYESASPVGSLPHGSFDLIPPTSSPGGVKQEDEPYVVPSGAQAHARKRSIKDVASMISRRGSEFSATGSRIPSTISSPESMVKQTTENTRKTSRLRYDEKALDVKDTLEKQLTQMKERADIGLMYLLNIRAQDPLSASCNWYSPADLRSIANRGKKRR